ncbi:hypothetical protein Xen7305DRAFT_00022800 [Xenococcus sp. PCC 7305]|uniref:slr1659 superfamily regulator n=1 Tax=Xenococcus sp. PCC 7305 TaxID=102125 RepID=UPI0002ABA66E|nr:hypothetical protein [Xenococcus sp. PCC 7305]ELS02565.1 hypothetical protein Xen7305DRAFT_00022800 [Xenococcus sp. PCC 7305]
MEIKAENYHITYDSIKEMIAFQGALRLSGADEYSAIFDFLNGVLDKEPMKISLNLRELKFLNSSGISMLSKFVINVRKKKNVQILVLGASDNPWQSKSLKNLQRLMPSLVLEIK